MSEVEQDLAGVYEYLLGKRASEGMARDATLALARELMPCKDDYAVRETVARAIAGVRLKLRRADKPTDNS
jgi:hypothetical protein